MSASLYVKDPAASRYVAGGVREAETLFGTPLPDLPALERDGEHEVFLVHTHHHLRALLYRYLESLLAQIGVAAVARSTDPARDVAQYEQALMEVLRSVRATDRRQGLLNLFWLAHSRDAAEHLLKLEPRAPALRRGKQSLFPLLQSFYRGLDRASRQEDGQATLWAEDENPALVASLIDDGFAFTEVLAESLDLTLFLDSNKRYRIAPDVFFEIQHVLVREAERRLREGDRGLLARTSQYLPGLPREQYLKPESLVKIVLSEPVLTYLLADPFGAGARLTASPILRVESKRRRSAEAFEAFLDLAAGLRRFEILSHVRERVVLLGSATEERDLEDKRTRGLRLYEFGEAASQVLNNAVPATILFLDLRGFTRTSEGQISERDLTRELYVVFDDFVPIIERFGGTVDKYLGDGMMVTWGTSRVDALDPLNALRAAVLCQESLRQRREEKLTWFKMGIAIHHGRVYLARFTAGRGGVHATVIGRNVNLAGRLSSATRRPMDDEDEEAAAPAPPETASGLHVSVDEDGTLFNEGVAISRDTLVQLETHIAVVHGDEGMEYEDEIIDRRLMIRYAGDAKFKGVRSSLPVYSVDYAGRG
ncbi:MAG: adenylate/guanylate cyclase domain-containing protein [Vicinamibacteria bacterium]